MKMLFSTLLLFLLVSNSFSVDTLEIDSSFRCPLTNPLYFKYYKDKFYISREGEANVYIVTRAMECVDTIITPLTRIDALTLHNDFLWIIPDSSISKRIEYQQVSENELDSTEYRSYSIYKIDLTSGMITDSVVFEISNVNLAVEKFILGLEVCDEEFVVAINGGFSLGVIFIEINKPHNMRNGCCAHPMGMVAIGKDIYAIRTGGKALINFNTDSVTLPNTIAYTLTFSATDIAYDGQNIWLCDPFNSMLHKMQSLHTSSTLFPVNKKPINSVHNMKVIKPVMFNGRTLRQGDKNARQIMILIEDEKATKSIFIDRPGNQ